MGVGSYIGEVCCAAPTTADDMALGASSLDTLQRLVTAAVDNSKLERYILQPAKSVILAAVTQCRRASAVNLDINISMDGVKMPVVTETMHLGILRSADSQLSTVTHNIDKARRTTYCLMGAGLHGHSGLDPDTSIHVLQTYILPLLVYGLEVLLPRKTLMEKAERFYKKLLKQILSLPNTTADPAVYILTGTIPLEGVIHSRALTLFGSICRLDENAVEKQVARRQLSIKGDNSCSWFVDIRNILRKYDLPSPWILLDTPPSKYRWKRTVKTRIDKYWADMLRSRVVLYPSLQYLSSDHFKPGERSVLIQDPNGIRDVPRMHTKIKLVTGTYMLQVNRSSFNQNQISPVCLLCKQENESLEHFLLRCVSLDHIRRPILDDIQRVCAELGILLDWHDTSRLVQFILDCTMLAVELQLTTSDTRAIEKQTRRLCHALHIERFKRLPTTVTKRNRTKRKTGRSTDQ